MSSLCYNLATLITFSGCVGGTECSTMGEVVLDEETKTQLLGHVMEE